MTTSKYFTFHKDLPNTIVYGINLKDRKDKRKAFVKLCERRNIPLNLYIAERHPEGGKRGCLLSHLHVIETAYKNRAQSGAKNLLIFEDDISIIAPFSSLQKVKIPTDYDMLYFGGTVHRIMGGGGEGGNETKGWVRMSCWTTHAYLINLERDEMVQKIIHDLRDYREEIDRYYINEIHSVYKAYMCDPMIVIQQAGYSDIEGREVNYDFMTQTLRGLRTPEYSVGANQEYILKLPNIAEEDLPMITLITPTRNRSHLFPIALRNYALFDYPREKLEWVIVEDGDQNLETSGLLPKSPLIKHIYLGDSGYTIAAKRNIGVQHSSRESKYILHMDDDDYYPPESVLARVKLLMKYENMGVECVGCSLIGTYNLLSDTSSMASDGMLSFSEASMGYTKRLWEQRPFDGDCERGEHKPFMEGRLEKMMDIPYSFVIIAFNHKHNFSDVYRGDRGERSDKGLIKVNGKVANFYDMWDLDTQLFVEELRATLL